MVAQKSRERIRHWGGVLSEGDGDVVVGDGHRRSWKRRDSSDEIRRLQIDIMSLIGEGALRDCSRSRTSRNRSEDSQATDPSCHQR